MEKQQLLKNFSANLRAERARAKLTQEDLAEASDTTMEYISRLENGKACPSILVVASIAKVLDVSLDTLINLDKLS